MAISGPPIVARTGHGVSSIARSDWDRLAGDRDPFLSHDFLSLLEISGSIGPGTGWHAAPIIIDDSDGVPVAALPAYIKGHSQGEYVFDHGWADAWTRAGGQYYPKLQICVPFTPVPGRRLLFNDAAMAPALIAAAEALVIQNGLSSAHATFVAPEQLDYFRDAGWLIRRDSQFHWHNRGYDDFDAFLGALSSRKRKAIRKERATAQAAVNILSLTGETIRPEHWDIMWACYQDTGARKWGQPYLTRAAFDRLAEQMADRILMVVATEKERGEPVAAALNFIGADALYGRYWGCLVDIDCLHFELCYYQAIDFALAHGLSRVEAGAQGGHKLARGYEPVATWSAHFIPHDGFRSAVADFLAQELRASEQESAWLDRFTPFKQV
ncbi:MAG: GNAT family N-acetyltransferase [Sphingopyxis sp.]